MSAKVLGQCWELDLPANQMMVLLAMADHADHTGANVYPSIGLVAWKTGYSERQVKRIVKQLVTARILVVVERKPGEVIKYRIDMNAGIKKAAFERGQSVTSDTDQGGDKMSLPAVGGGQNVTTGGDIAMSPEPSIEPSIKDTATANADAPPLTVIHRRNEWYDAIHDIWEYSGKMNGAMEKMLRGTATAKAWKEGNVGVALTPQDVRDWAAWYRRTELKGDAHLNMLENRMKIASSIERWDKLGRPRENKVTGYSGIVNIVDPWADAS